MRNVGTRKISNRSVLICFGILTMQGTTQFHLHGLLNLYKSFWGMKDPSIEYLGLKMGFVLLQLLMIAGL